MKLGLILPYEGGLSFPEIVELTQRAEALDFDSVWVPEAWGTDAISILGALAARTDHIRLGTGIVNVFSRSPTLLGQTAATLDLISGGRFILGLGTSGHQVVSGWHGVPFEKPLQRVRETIEIVRRVVRREPVTYHGQVFHLDKGLKLLARPVRPEIPIFLATLTPAGLRLTAELADGWMPIVYSPAHADVFRPDLEAGARLSGRSLDSLQIAPAMPVAIDDDIALARDQVRAWAALYIGGMGSKTKNFYNDLVRRYGFVDDAIAIQDLYLGGQKREAIARVPDALLDAIAIVGPPAVVEERLAAAAGAGVTLLLAALHAPEQAGRLRALDVLASGLPA